MIMSKQLRRRTVFVRPGPGEWVQWSFQGTWIPEQYHTRTKWEAVMYWLRETVPVENTSAAEAQQWLVAMGMALRDLHVVNEVEDDEPIPHHGPEYFRRSEIQLQVDETVLLAICSQAYPLNGGSVPPTVIVPGKADAGAGGRLQGNTVRTHAGKTGAALLADTSRSSQTTSPSTEDAHTSSRKGAQLLGGKGRPPGIPANEPMKTKTRQVGRPYILLPDVPWVNREETSNYPPSIGGGESAAAGIDGQGSSGAGINDPTSAATGIDNPDPRPEETGIADPSLSAGMQVESVDNAGTPEAVAGLVGAGIGTGTRPKGRTVTSPSQPLPLRRSTRPRTRKPRA